MGTGPGSGPPPPGADEAYVAFPISPSHEASNLATARGRGREHGPDQARKHSSTNGLRRSLTGTGGGVGPAGPVGRCLDDLSTLMS